MLNVKNKRIVPVMNKQPASLEEIIVALKAAIEDTHSTGKDIEVDEKYLDECWEGIKNCVIAVSNKYYGS